MTFYENMLEVSYNPFILFSHEGKVLSLNQSAQFLLGSVSAHILFEHAVSHATTSFGFKTTHLDLSFGRFHFFALCIGYENEEEIGILLYRSPSTEPKFNSVLQSRHTAVNIYSLIDLCISSTSIGTNRDIIRDFDPTLPEIRIDSNQFIKMFSLILSASGDNNNLTIKLSLTIGEYIKIEKKKYTIFSIKVTNSTPFDPDNQYRIENYAHKLGAKFSFDEKEIILDLAIIS